jgi:tetratricopeptide (TPR) repeat protein
MKKSILILALSLAVLAMIGFGIIHILAQRLDQELDQARGAVGKRQGSQLLEKLARSHPNHAEIQFLCARQFRLEGDNDRALIRCRRAAELGYWLAQVERETLLIRANKNFSEAEPELERLLEANPEDPDLLLTLAQGWSQLGNLTKAVTFVNSILARDRKNAGALLIRGKIRLQKHQPFDACEDLEAAMAASRDQYYHSRALVQLANCYLELGRFAEALDLFMTAELEEPENPRILFGIGRCCWFLDRWDDAGEAFREVLRLKPDHLDALSQLAYIQEERGQSDDLAQALQLLEQAAKLDPTWYDLHFRMAKIMKALGQDERAAQEFDRAEKVKKAWAKPRGNPFTGRNPYTGDEPGALRNPVDD